MMRFFNRATRRELCRDLANAKAIRKRLRVKARDLRANVCELTNHRSILRMENVKLLEEHARLRSEREAMRSQRDALLTERGNLRAALTVIVDEMLDE